MVERAERAEIDSGVKGAGESGSGVSGGGKVGGCGGGISVRTVCTASSNCGTVTDASNIDKATMHTLTSQKLPGGMFK